MIKIGDILWEFSKNDFNIYEIVDIHYVSYLKRIYLYVDINVLIGNSNISGIFLNDNEDYTKLGTLFGKYYTINEQVALNYIRTHFNETDN